MSDYFGAKLIILKEHKENLIFAPIILNKYLFLSFAKRNKRGKVSLW